MREYDSSFGTEYFISIENEEYNILYGLCRLRLSTNAGFIRNTKKNKLGGKHIISSKTEVAFPELINCALIRVQTVIFVNAIFCTSVIIMWAKPIKPVTVKNFLHIGIL